ncbi:MAG: hypothetical protein ACYTG0_20825 [Planctomycetota bacterium]|jgi:hypothetical protein
MSGRRSIAWWILIVALGACCSTCGAESSAAHPVSVTRAYVYVSPEHATASIQVFVEDLFLFHDLKPNDRDFLEPDVIRRGIELHEQFVARRFVVRDVAGEPVACRVVDVRQLDLPDEGVPLAELMAHRLTFELEYAFSSPPEFLTFSQNFTDDEGVLPSEMSLLVRQRGAAETHTAQLRPGDLEIVRFRWDLPPLSPEASAEQRESWVAQQKEETLGITSYSSVYSFLYIDDYEVRHEILIPLLTLEPSVLIARDDDELLDVAEQEAARQQIEAYFRSGNPIEVDGVRMRPGMERCDFYGLDFRDFAQRAPRKPVPMVTARVGIILSYPLASPAQTVSLTWDRFNRFVWTINTVVFAYDETCKTTLTRLAKNNVFRWENPGRLVPPPLGPVAAVFPPPPTLSLPVLSLSCLIVAPAVVLAMTVRRVALRRRLLVLGAFFLVAALGWPFLRWKAPHPFATHVEVSDEQAEKIFVVLHENVYRAFEFREESEVYDALATSIHGDLLRDVYLQIRRGLEMQEQGGAVSRIREVSIVAGQTEPLPAAGAGRQRAEHGFARRTTWTVAGTVEHWGHVHQRTNQYEALFVVEPVDKAWKITDMVLLDERRLQFETRLRGL